MLKLSFLVVLMSILSSVRAMAGHKQMISMYAYHVLEEKCFGISATTLAMYRQNVAMLECDTEVARNYSEVFDRLRNQNYISNNNINDNTDLSSEKPVQAFTEDNLKKISDNLIIFNAKIRCTLLKQNIISEDNSLNITSLTNKYSGMTHLDSKLKANLELVVKDCLMAASCAPVSDDNGIPASINKAMTFLSCEKRRKALACAKHGLEQKSAMFNEQGIGNFESIGMSGNGNGAYMKSFWAQYVMDLDIGDYGLL